MRRFLAAEEYHPEHTWDCGDALGPSHWGDLKQEFAPCKNVHHQSPIDIRNPKQAALPPIQFDYKPSPLNIIDNGHTNIVTYSPAWRSAGYALKPPVSVSLFVSVCWLFVVRKLHLGGDKRYALFHRPSEEKINGKGFDMSVHLVRVDDGGKLAVVAVLPQAGEDSPLVHELWNDLPEEKDKEEFYDNVPDQSIADSAARSRLLHLVRFSDLAALQRGRDVVRTQASHNNFGGRDPAVFSTLSRRRATDSAFV